MFWGLIVLFYVCSLLLFFVCLFAFYGIIERHLKRVTSTNQSTDGWRYSGGSPGLSNGVGQNISLHASPAVKTSTPVDYLVYAVPVHSISPPPPSKEKCEHEKWTMTFVQWIKILHVAIKFQELYQEFVCLFLSGSGYIQSTGWLFSHFF